jgi:hypothetical protein
MGILLSGAACSSDERTPDVDSRSIRFAVSPVTQTAGETRAVLSGNYLPVDDHVGIYAYSYLTSDLPETWPTPLIFDNVKGTVGSIPTEEGDPQKISIAPENEKDYATGHKHAFYSYYPYQSSLSDFTITSDLFESQTDWLWATPVTGVMASADPVPFTYSHQMSLIRFFVGKAAEVVPKLRLESITVVTSASQKFTFNVSTGDIVGVDGGSTSYTASLLTDGVGLEVPFIEDAEKASEILLVPASAVTSLSFRVNGEDFVTPGEWTGLTTSSDGGKFKQVNITINVTEIIVKLGAKDWDNGDPIDLSQSEVSISLGAKDWEHDPATDTDLTQSGVSISLGAKDWADGKDVTGEEDKPIKLN